MCFMNCTYENFHGECTKGEHKPSDGDCQRDLIEEDQDND